jgi:isopenicillin N synthase-like dioxygenase
VQHRRHARSHDRRSLPLDPASRAQPGRGGRISFPLFFDPGFDARVQPVESAGAPLQDDAASRWDRTSVHAFSGTYGEYLLGKVNRVFPQPGDAVLRD